MPSLHTGDRIVASPSRESVASKEWDWAGGAVAVGVEDQREREEHRKWVQEGAGCVYSRLHNAQMATCEILGSASEYMSR